MRFQCACSYACGADGRSLGVQSRDSKFSRMGRLLHFLTHAHASGCSCSALSVCFSLAYVDENTVKIKLL